MKPLLFSKLIWGLLLGGFVGCTMAIYEVLTQPRWSPAPSLLFMADHGVKSGALGLFMGLMVDICVTIYNHFRRTHSSAD